jgi:formate dehydrogenase subunit delta
MTGVSAEQRMANQIAANQRHLPEADAVTAVAGHIDRFWNSFLRDRLYALVDAGGKGLDPVVVKAVERIRT